LPSTLHTSSTTGKIRFIRTFLFGHLCFDVAQTKERSHVATKSRLRAIQPNHLCHRSLAFLHDNVITFNVFVLASCFDVLMLLRLKKEVTLPRYHALEQSNHPCHGRLAFFHDNVITSNVFKIAYAFPQQPMDFSICSICGHTCANLQQTWILPQKHPMN